MRAASSMIAATTATLLVILPAGIAAADDVPLHGSWQLDPQASVDDLGAVSRWSSMSPEETEKLRASLEGRAGELGFELSVDGLTFRRGDRETHFSCTERYDRPPVALFACSTEAVDFTFTIVRLEGGKIKLLSSVTDDMDIYAWRRAE